MDLRISVPLLCNSVSISSVLVSLPVFISVSVSFPVSISVSVSISVPVSVSVSVPAMVIMIAVVILCKVVITVGGPCRIRMPVLTVSLVVFMVAVFPDMWLAVAMVMVMMVVVMIVLVVAVMMLVVISSLRPVSLQRFTHFSVPLLMQVPSAEPLARIPAGLRFPATRCLVVLTVILHPAVVMMMVVVGVLRCLWFLSQELLCFSFLALFIPLILCWAWRSLLVYVVLLGTFPLGGTSLLGFLPILGQKSAIELSQLCNEYMNDWTWSRIKEIITKLWTSYKI